MQRLLPPDHLTTQQSEAEGGKQKQRTALSVALLLSISLHPFALYVFLHKKLYHRAEGLQRRE